MYYADYPYIRIMPNWQADRLNVQIYPISAQGVIAWQDAVAAHASQISTFWESDAEMRTAIMDYYQLDNGVKIWR
jgi:hypothetical protein